MKAAAYHSFGPPETVIEVTDVEKPVPKDNEVLIKVRAASANPLDVGFMKGKPYTFRLLFGLRKPRRTRPGVDVAGEIEGAGHKVTQFKLGDAVFGVCRGAFAEYACAPEAKLVLKPANVTFEQAASAPVAGLTALQGLRDKGKVQPGQKVLIHGAGGGVGTFAVQIAKALGANVTAVTSTSNLDLVRSIGADQVVDYTKEDFTKRGERYDQIFDCSADRPLSAVRACLNPKGAYLMVGGPPHRWTIGLFALPLKGLVLSAFVSQRLTVFVANANQGDLATLGELMRAGKLKPVIDRCYPLRQVADALRHVDERRARGKVLIVINP